MRRLLIAAVVAVVPGVAHACMPAYADIAGSAGLTAGQCRVIESGALAAAVERGCETVWADEARWTIVLAGEMVSLRDLLPGGALAPLYRRMEERALAVLEGQDLCRAGMTLFGPAGTREPGLIKVR
jgi:hypothetical protein